MAWYDKWAIMATAAAVGLAGYEGIQWGNMDATLWAYWVGAMGTVSTLIGTIWLATAETRKRNSHELSVARVTASAIRPQVREIEHICRNVCKDIDAITKFYPSQPIPTYRLKAIGLALETLDFWTIQEIVPLVALPGHCAEKLAGARGIVATTATIFKNTKVENDTQKDIVEFILAYLVMMENAVQLMDEAAIDMRVAIQSGFPSVRSS